MNHNLGDAVLWAKESACTSAGLIVRRQGVRWRWSCRSGGRGRTRARTSFLLSSVLNKSGDWLLLLFGTSYHRPDLVLLLASLLPGGADYPSSETYSATSCAASFTCSSFTCHLRAGVEGARRHPGPEGLVLRHVLWAIGMTPPLCTRMCPGPFFEAPPPDPPVKTGTRVRRFRGCSYFELKGEQKNARSVQKAN